MDKNRVEKIATRLASRVTATRKAKTLTAKGKTFADYGDYGDQLWEVARDYKRELESVFDGIAGRDWDADVENSGDHQFEVQGSDPNWATDDATGDEFLLVFGMSRNEKKPINVEVWASIDGSEDGDDKQFPADTPIKDVLEWIYSTANGLF